MKANYEEKIEEQKVSGNLNMNLYDLNKSVIKQLPDYTKEQLTEAAKTIDAFINDNTPSSTFYMLLGREINYYTVFMRCFNENSDETVGEALISCLEHFNAPVKSIESTKNGDAIEIWVMNDDEPTVMYFFTYNEGVVICK